MYFERKGYFEMKLYFEQFFRHLVFYVGNLMI